MLYVCATPIGNLGDVSERLLDTLKKVDVVYSERPEVTLKLLSKFSIRKPVKPYHERSYHRALRELTAGKDICLVCTAGMPGISDPGRELVRACYEHGIELTVIPGPSALCTAMAYAPFQLIPMVFLGFLPRKRGQAKAVLESYSEHDVSLCLFESPRRVNATLELIREIFPNRELLILHELTKLHEKIWYIHPSEPVPEVPERGEYTLLISKQRP